MDEPTKPQLLLCIPGPWADRTAFLQSIVSETGGKFIFAGMILANPRKQEHIELDLLPHYSDMRSAFEIAGQGKLPISLLNAIAEHHSVAYLHFPLRILEQVERLRSFTQVVKSCGGIAIKIESAGIAHEWSTWFAALSSENPFDLYRSFVVLIGDSHFYYSCGMHHFGLPDVEVSSVVGATEAADLMNRFNYWQIVEKPKIASGHTFSLTPDSPRYRITLVRDTRHTASELFHNPNGLWRLTNSNA
jgi:hypothetical protein